MRILIITDDSSVVRQVLKHICSENMHLTYAGTLADAITAASSGRFAVALLDPHLPDAMGAQAIEKLRTALPLMPIVIIGDGDDVIALTRGFGFGADDAAMLSELPDSLLDAISRVTGTPRAAPFVVTAGDYTLAFAGPNLSLNGARVHLSLREARLLALLAHDPPRIFTKQELVWQMFPGDDVEIKVLDVHVTRTRRLLASAADGEIFIRTVWGRGFHFGVADPNA